VSCGNKKVEDGAGNTDDENSRTLAVLPNPYVVVAASKGSLQ